LKWVALAVVLPALVMVSFAASVTRTDVTYQAQAGTLSFVYFETASGSTSTTPGTNTAQTPPTGTGTYEILVGDSEYVYSPQFAASTTISAGVWVFDYWALGLTLAGSMTISIATVTSTGTVQTTVVSAASETLTLTKTQIVLRASSPQVTVPANGYIRVQLTAPALSAAEISWGSGQLTNVQVPYRVLST
jgi:hypothetical protein